MDFVRFVQPLGCSAHAPLTGNKEAVLRVRSTTTQFISTLPFIQYQVCDARGAHDAVADLIFQPLQIKIKVLCFRLTYTCTYWRCEITHIR